MLKPALTLALSSLICVLAAACTEPPPSQTRSREGIATPTGPPRATTPTPSSITSNRILSLDVNRCAIPDPAIDAWDTGAGISVPPLVPEIHAGLTKLTGDQSSSVDLELAESFTTDPSGTVYTFKLRPNLKFSDGSPITAADVKASWERALRLARPGGYASKFLQPIKGADSIISGNSTEIEGVEVIDDRTVRVHLAKPNQTFELNIAHPVASVLKSENVANWDGTWSNYTDPHPADRLTYPHPAIELFSHRLPVGAGPFKLTTYASDSDFQRCVLTRNDHYWGKQAELEYIVLENHTAQVIPAGFPDDLAARLFNQQTIDANTWVLLDLTDEQMDDLDSVPDVHKISIPIEIAVFALNDTRHPLNVAEVRQTLMNNADVVKRLYGAPFPRPHRIVPQQIQHMVGAVAPIQFDTTTHVPHELKYDEVPGTFYILDDDVVVRFGFQPLLSDITDEWWEEFGIDLRTINRSSDDYSHVARTSGFDARLWQTSIQSPDPRHFFASFAKPFGESQAHSNWDILPPLFSKLDQSADEATRHEIYAQIEQTMLDNYLGITLFWSVGWLPVRIQPYVHGLTGATFPRSLFHNVWMDDSAPTRPIP